MTLDADLGGLKIRVSVVRFHPWPPYFQGPFRTNVWFANSSGSAARQASVIESPMNTTRAGDGGARCAFSRLYRQRCAQSNVRQACGSPRHLSGSCRQGPAKTPTRGPGAVPGRLCGEQQRPAWSRRQTSVATLLHRATELAVSGSRWYRMPRWIDLERKETPAVGRRRSN